MSAIEEAVEAAVLLLERMVNTELRRLEGALRRRSGDCIPSV